MNKGKKGVFFDMDGVLVQTEKLRAEIHARTVEIFGGTIPVSFYGEIGGVGRSHNEVRKEYLAKSGIAVSEDEYGDMFHRLFREAIETIEPAQGIPRLLWEIRKSGCVLGLVSSSERSIIEKIIVQTRLWRFFEVIVAGDDVAEVKPFPDGYALALRHLGVSPKNAIAIEDSESGIRSAQAAGLQVIAFRHSENKKHDFSGTVEIDSFRNTFSILKLISEVLS